jgi:hypothetical protein
MSKPILTITCPAITSRGTTSGKVFEELQRQVDNCKQDVELLIIMDNCKMPIGDKMCKLNHMASGDYIMAVGDDDFPEPCYVEEICKAIAANPGVDVVTFNMAYHCNGVYVSDFIYGLGRKCIAPEKPTTNHPRANRYGQWAKEEYKPGDAPHQRCAIRREIVQSYYYPEGIWYAEDYVFRDFMRDNNMLKTEVHVDKVLYKIYFEQKKRYDCNWKRAQEKTKMYPPKK